MSTAASIREPPLDTRDHNQRPPPTSRLLSLADIRRPSMLRPRPSPLVHDPRRTLCHPSPLCEGRSPQARGDRARRRRPDAGGVLRAIAAATREYRAPRRAALAVSDRTPGRRQSSSRAPQGGSAPRAGLGAEPPAMPRGRGHERRGSRATRSYGDHLALGGSSALSAVGGRRPAGPRGRRAPRAQHRHCLCTHPRTATPARASRRRALELAGLGDQGGAARGARAGCDPAVAGRLHRGRGSFVARLAGTFRTGGVR